MKYEQKYDTRIFWCRIIYNIGRFNFLKRNPTNIEIEPKEIESQKNIITK